MSQSPLNKLIGIVSVAPILFLFGVAASIGLHVLVPTRIVQPVLWQNMFLGAGVFLVFAGTALSLWAERVVSKNVHSEKNPEIGDLMQGPYKYSRHPASLGLGIIFAGLTLAVNSIVMAVLTILFWMLMTMSFAPAEERFMIRSVGQVYRDYQDKVRMWF